MDTTQADLDRLEARLADTERRIAEARLAYLHESIEAAEAYYRSILNDVNRLKEN